MAYLEELLPEFRKGARIRKKDWDKDLYLYYKDGLIYDQYHQPFYSFSAKSISGDCWEIYQEPIDWQYIIDHKCLCWFGGDCQNRGRFGILVNVNYDDENPYFPYKESWGDVWEDCRPARRDEVTFYEEKEDEI